jgi:hypothetical protein
MGSIGEFQTCTFFMHNRGCYGNNKEPSPGIGQPPIKWKLHSLIGRMLAYGAKGGWFESQQQKNLISEN